MTNRGSAYAIGLILVFSLSRTIAASQENVIISLNVGECSLAVESNDKGHTLRLRAHHPKYKGCQIDKEAVLSTLNAAFLKTEWSKLEGSYSSLSIGRLIDYPWLTQYLATTAYRDRGWDSKKGKPAAVDINQYASQLLFRNELTVQLDTVLKKSGYRVTGVTVEKVLVGGFREIPFYQGEMYPGRVPYDAQVWFRLQRN